MRMVTLQSDDPVAVALRPRHRQHARRDPAALGGEQRRRGRGRGAHRRRRRRGGAWQACHGGQRRTAEYLLARGADVNARPEYAPQTPLEIAGALDTRKENVVGWLRDIGAEAAGTRAR
jgi:hypothetical protein